MGVLIFIKVKYYGFEKTQDRNGRTGALMGKDIIKRDTPQNRVLYEPAEPLFPPLKRNVSAVRIVRAAVCLVLLCAAVTACIVVGIRQSSASGGTGDGTEHKPLGTVTDGRDSTHESQTNELTEATSDEVADGKMEGDATVGDVTETAESVAETVPDTTEGYMDISEIEKGEGYVVNYTSKRVDVSGLLDRGFIFSEKPNGKAPLVLIIHTHTSEEYSTIQGGKKYPIDSVVAAGERLASVLNARGIEAVHCTVIHDADDSNAYLNARDTIITMLKIYPSIKYVIDVHRMMLRDEEGRELRTKTTLDGAAQIRLTVSTDQKREGAWQDDVSLALAIRGELNDDSQRLCAPVVISHGGYNGDLCRFFLMADVGSSRNSTEEAMRSAEKLANALADVILDD